MNAWRSRARAALFAPALTTLLFVGACQGRPRTEGAPGAKEPPKPRSGPAVGVFDVSGGVPEEEAQSILGGSHKKSFDALVFALDDVADEKDVKAVLVKLGGASLGMARAYELGGMLRALGKAGKPVYCHADGFTNTTILAAARGCTKLYVSPAGEVETIGVAAQIIYMRRLLADELKISIDFLQIGKFKGAEEPLTRDGPSDEARASLEGVLADMRASWLDGIREGRPQPSVADAVEDGPYAPKRAKELGLVDEIGYADEALADLKKVANAPREDARFGGSSSEKADDLGDVLRVLVGSGGGAPIALVRATGSISMSGGSGLLGGRGGITEKELSRTLAKIEHDDDVKAVVLRIDSPGGSALASDLLWHDLMRIRKKKPLVVSVGEMAASGGYYLASTGSFIYADPTSIVGSIGVVGGKLAIGGALERIGVHAETFTGKGKDPKAEARAAYLSPFVAWDEPTRVRVRETMTGIYDLFLARVSEGRSVEGRTVPVARIAESAEGRIFSGREGKARGLVDELGGLRDAIVRARALANLPEDADVRVFGAKPSFLEALEPSQDSEERAHALDATLPRPIDALAAASPDVAVFAEGLLPLAEGERSVTAMPFAFVVR